ncbi:hypothetical protein [Nocardia jejuensis]|uniref:hypothetical protein n=1 Tax=Nocardia jejuensis TaxID=328049 RepID=UPI00082DD085|nr:hypothetical protein [Nocardia jejuensis]
MTKRAELVQIIEELDGRLPVTHSTPAATLTARVLTLWDKTLSPIERRQTSLPDEARLLDVTEQLDVVAAAFSDCLWIETTSKAEPIQVPVPADSAAFIAPDRLLITAPSAWRPGRQFSESHRVLLLNLAGEILAETLVEVDDATPHLLRHPTDPTVVCDFAMGQDGNTLAVIQAADDELVLREIFRTEEFVNLAFDPTGKRLLLGPYPTDPSRAVVASWPNLDILASLDAESLGLAIGFDIHGGYLNDDRVLLLGTEQAPVLATGSLTDATIIDMKDLEAWAGADGFVESIAPLSDDLFAAVLWEHGQRTTTLWRICDG